MKYRDIAEQIDHRTVSLKQTVWGIRRFICGLSKKVLISNVMATCADSIYDHGISDMTNAMALAASLCYTVQIYYDFSGYSDMAIGLGKMFGFEFKENFNYPYISGSICEFWRRWHISLSTWFREYVYIPLGGNRKEKIKTYRNLLTVFFLTGLWHGAGYNFIFWGLFHGGVSGVGTSTIWKEAGTTENYWMDLHSGHCEYWLDLFSSDGYAASDGSS